MTHAAVLLLIAASAAACGSKPKATSASATAEAAGRERLTMDSGPRPNPKTDALWALAPLNADGGIVLADGSLPRLLAGAAGLFDLLRGHPVSAAWLRGAARDLPGEIGAAVEHPPTAASWASQGIDIDGGLALFGGRAEDSALLVLPVVDRAKLRATFGLTTETHDGIEVDRLGPFLCTMSGEHYTCAPSMPALRAVTSRPGNPTATRAAAMPGYLRGDIELVVDAARVEALELAAPMLSSPETLAVTATFDAGALTLRAWLHGTPSGPLVSELPGVPNALGPDIARHTPSGVFRMRVPTGLLAEGAPATLPLQGRTIALRSFLASLTGELIVFSPSSLAPYFEIALGLSDRAAADEVVATACAVVRDLGLEAKSRSGGCSIHVSKAWLVAADPSFEQLPIDGAALGLEVTEDRATMTIDPLGASVSRPIQIQPSAVRSELLSQPWTVAVWGTTEGAIDFVADGDGPTFAERMLTDGDTDAVLLTAYLAAQVHELAVAVAVRPDGAHALIHLELYAADGPEVWAAYRAAVLGVLQGTEPWSRAAERLAKEYPHTRVGRAVAPGSRSGGMLFVVVTSVGVLTAIAVPSAMAYIQKSKTTEARHNIQRLFEGALAHHARHGLFVTTSTPLTPEDPTDCCETCAPDASLWTDAAWVALAFSVDDPHYYSYQYIYDPSAGPSGGFTVRAHGDLDCDGVWSTFEMYGAIPPRPDDGGLWRQDETE